MFADKQILSQVLRDIPIVGLLNILLSVYYLSVEYICMNWYHSHSYQNPSEYKLLWLLLFDLHRRKFNRRATSEYVNQLELFSKIGLKGKPFRIHIELKNAYQYH